MVPALLLLLKMKQLEAFGTSLAALVPPSGLLGAIEYYRNGYTNIRWAAVLSLGMLFGVYFGARFVIAIPPTVARRIYGLFLLIVGARFLIVGR